MKVNIELNSFESNEYELSTLEKIAEETIRSSSVVGDGIDITVSVAIVDDIEIRKINKKLRDKDVVTDVISIGDYSDNEDISKVKGEVFLGEVVLCYNYIKESARENNISVDEEFFTVYSHGILHLLGFKHGEEMFQLQEKVAKKFCNL